MLCNTPKISSFSSLYCIGLSHKCLKEINRSLTAVHRGFWTKYDSIIHNDAFYGGKVHPVLSSHTEFWTVFICKFFFGYLISGKIADLIAQTLFELYGAGWWHHWINDELTLWKIECLLSSSCIIDTLCSCLILLRYDVCFLLCFHHICILLDVSDRRWFVTSCCPLAVIGWSADGSLFKSSVLQKVAGVTAPGFLLAASPKCVFSAFECFIWLLV